MVYCASWNPNNKVKGNTHLSKKNLLPLLLALPIFLYLFNAVLLYTNYPPFNIDESWFTQPAYYLVHEGNLATPMVAGLANIEDHTYWMTPAHFIAVAAGLELFGYDPLLSRQLTLFFGFLSLIPTFLIARRLFPEYKWIAVISIVVLASEAHFTRNARGGRVEPLMTLFFLWSLYALLWGQQSGKQQGIALAGAFAALSFLSHPNAVFLIIGLLIVLYLDLPRIDNRITTMSNKIRNIVWFGIGGVVTSIPYLLYFLQAPSDAIDQLRSNSNSGLASVFQEWERYIDWMGSGIPYLLPVNILFVAGVGFTIYYAVKEKDSRLSLLLILLLSRLVGIAIQGNKASFYLGVISPILALLLAYATIKSSTIIANISIVPKFLSSKPQLWILLIIAGFVFYNSVVRLYILNVHRSTSITEAIEQVDQELAPDDVIVADGRWWLVEPEQPFLHAFARQIRDKPACEWLNVNGQLATLVITSDAFEDSHGDVQWRNMLEENTILVKEFDYILETVEIRRVTLTPEDCVVP